MCLSGCEKQSAAANISFAKGKTACLLLHLGELQSLAINQRPLVGQSNYYFLCTNLPAVDSREEERTLAHREPLTSQLEQRELKPRSQSTLVAQSSEKGPTTSCTRFALHTFSTCAL